MTEWLEHKLIAGKHRLVEISECKTMLMLEASARQKRGGNMAASGCDKYHEMMLTRGASASDHEKHWQAFLAQNRMKMRTKGPAKMSLVMIETRVVFQQSTMSMV